jgi:dTDP-4-dehydrorhamnose 3,5-epimerase
LVRVVTGKVRDVAVDIRRNSPFFGQHVITELSEENKQQLFIPKGFAHGFVVLSKEAIFSYKADTPYAPEYDRGIYYTDPDLGINWRLDPSEMHLSDKDNALPYLRDAEIVTI